MQHIIKKQIINLSLQKKLDAFHIQQKISADYWSHIVPILEKTFDDISTADETISIDTLELDLGAFSEKEIEEGEWHEILAKKIAEQLLPVRHQLSSQLTVQRKAKLPGIADQWSFYMQHGYLPWNVIKIDDEWYQQVLEAFAADAMAIEKLRKLITINSVALKRIILRHDEKFLIALLETLTARSQVKIPELLNPIISDKKDLLKSIPAITLQQQLWYRVLEIAAANKSLDAAEIAKQVENDISVPDKPFEQNFKEEHLKENIDDGIYVANAGVVLLHPFLPGFFRNIGFVEKENFVDFSVCQKAVVMLHYLATGNTIPEEHELVIPKMLCASPINEPVSNNISFSTEELREAEDLLTSSIAQWEILKGTSPAGLRESFLQRGGKLFMKNDQPHLQIEASAIDMLLDHLPWNLSMIMLPYLAHRPLTVLKVYKVFCVRGS